MRHLFVLLSCALLIAACAESCTHRTARPETAADQVKPTPKVIPTTVSETPPSPQKTLAEQLAPTPVPPCPITGFDQARLTAILDAFCDGKGTDKFISWTDAVATEKFDCDLQASFPKTLPSGKTVAMKHKGKRKEVRIVLWHRPQWDGRYQIALTEHVGVGMDDFVLADFRDEHSDGCLDFSAGHGLEEEYFYYGPERETDLAVHRKWQDRYDEDLEVLERLLGLPTSTTP